MYIYARPGLLSTLILLLWSIAPLTAQDEIIEQWAIAADASSQTSLSTASVNELNGPPDSNCEIRDDLGFDFVFGSWRTADPNEGPESVELTYAQPVKAIGVEVYQTLNPGSIVRVLINDTNGQWHEVWVGQSPTETCPAILRIEFPPPDFISNMVRLELDTSLISGWNQLDAIKLIGTPEEDTDSILFADAGVLSTYSNYIVCADYDNDGWPDMLATDDSGVPITPVLLHNEANGTFSNRTASLPIDGIDAPVSVFADYDNDGDLDLFIANGSIVRFTTLQDPLWRNEGGSFHNVSTQAGLTDVLVSSGAIWFDYDRDGALDLYVGHGAVSEDFISDVPNFLYRNNKDGTFTNTTDEAGLWLNLHTIDFPFKHWGTSSGYIGTDFNGDDWPDLYVAVSVSPNRLFINDQNGGFTDATTAEIGDQGRAVGAAIGDIDNDGDIDLFQANPGGRGESIREGQADRSQMLLNQGEGVFTDVTDGVGLGTVTHAFGRLVDFDNDGDLDLLTSFPHQVYLNDGKGFFSQLAFFSGLPGAFSVCDYDGDGFLDIWFGGLFRNLGNDNHYLRIDLVGTESNRDGIGAKSLAIAGSWRQGQQLLGGDGLMQDEPIIHYGLGQNTQIDTLEIRWPSGQVDILTDIPADQEIRVIEGRGEWYPAPRTIWTVEPPAEVPYGAEIDFIAVTKPALFEPTATITSITGDLSSLGGPADVPLIDQGDGTYRLETTFTVSGTSDLRDVEVFILQETSLGEHWINLSRNIAVQDDPFTAVLESYDGTTPEAFSLSQNYPNPFNSGTVIPYQLPTAGDVNLSVYNLAGQKVATLVDGQRQTGTYRVHWDGTDDRNGTLATGMYFYRLQAGEAIQTKKLLLLR